MFCNHCGKQLPEGSVFCNYCGNRLPQADTSPASLADPYAEDDLDGSSSYDFGTFADIDDDELEEERRDPGDSYDDYTDNGDYPAPARYGERYGRSGRRAPNLTWLWITLIVLLGAALVTVILIAVNGGFSSGDAQPASPTVVIATRPAQPATEAPTHPAPTETEAPTEQPAPTEPEETAAPEPQPTDPPATQPPEPTAPPTQADDTQAASEGDPGQLV